MRPSPISGKAVAPHAALEVRTGAGELVWRFDRDGQKPQQAIPPQVAADMIRMMNHVVRERHRRGAPQLDGIPTAGKTGTTNALSRRLVRRLHRQLHRRGLDRQ